MSNACKYCEKGEIEIGLFNYYNALVFYVLDHGLGIPAELQKNLFGAYKVRSVDYSARYLGSGLGLAVASRLAEIIGAELWVESQEGKGSTFYLAIRFPEEAF